MHCGPDISKREGNSLRNLPDGLFCEVPLNLSVPMGVGKLTALEPEGWYQVELDGPRTVLYVPEEVTDLVLPALLFGSQTVFEFYLVSSSGGPLQPVTIRVEAETYLNGVPGPTYEEPGEMRHQHYLRVGSGWIRLNN